MTELEGGKRAIQEAQAALRQAGERLQLELAKRERAEEELRQAHRELESRVKQRTADLSEALKRLKEQIAERKRTEAALRRAEAETRERLKEQIALREAGAAISSTLDRADVLTRIAEQMGQAVDATSVYVCTYDSESMLSTVAAEYIGPEASAKEQVSDLGAQYREHSVRRVETMQSGRHEIVNLDDSDLDEAERAHMLEYGAQTILYVPLWIREQYLGFIELWESRHQREFMPEEIALCQGIAQQAAIAIENARLYGRAQEEIAERSRVEKEREVLLERIRKRTRLLVQILDAVPDGVLLLSDQLCVILANPAALGFLDTLAGADVGDILTHLAGVPLGDLLKPPAQGTWHQVKAAGRYFGVVARPAHHGRTGQGWVLVLRDVTEERLTQRRVQQQERLAAVGQLAAGIAHDFSNIMSVIVLYAQVLQRSPDLSDKACERLATIDQQATRATDLIGQILDFSRRSVVERRPVDLVPLLKEHVKLLGRTMPASIKIRLVCGDGAYVVKADPTRVQQVMMNLAVNARDAMPEGGKLRIELEQVSVADGESAPLPEMGAGDWVKVAVSDTGRGISTDELPHIFEPFFTTKEPGKGSGLGLAQVYGIVKQHDGHIDVRTSPGQGATFSLYLPAMLQPEPAETQKKDPAAVPLGDGQTILVVEDNMDVLRALTTSLEGMNYRVLEATNGKEALEVFERQSHQVALVLTDLVMPEMGGQALIGALRRRDPDVKLVVVTGHSMKDGGEGLEAAGVTARLQKPIDLDELAEVIARVLRDG